MSFNKTKTDPELGRKVHAHLRSLGLETPVIDSKLNVDAKDKIESIEKHMTKILETMGMDLSDDSLIETPKRVAKMMVLEQGWGLKPENFPKCTVVDNKMNYDEMVVEKCSVNSICEHHWIFFGSIHSPELGAWIAYIPKKKVVGLSKLGRVMEYFSARPQIQERLTQQVLETLKFILETEDVAVVIKAQHFCVLTRGVEDAQANTITSALSGSFKTDLQTRSEFMAHIRKG